MKIFHDKTPTGKPTSRMVQDKGGKKPTVGVAGWMIFAILALMALRVIALISQ